MCRNYVCITVGSNLTSKYGTPIEEKPTVQLNLDVFADRDMYILTSTPGTTGHACRIRTKSWRINTLDLKHENKVDSRRVDTKELVEVPRECLVHLRKPVFCPQPCRPTSSISTYKSLTPLSVK